MPTNKELEARVKELEAQIADAKGGFSVIDADDNETAPEEGGLYRFTVDALAFVPADLPEPVRFRDADGEFAEPEEGGLYRYDGSGDLVAATWVPGAYLFTEGEAEPVRIGEGEWRLAQGGASCEIGAMVAGDADEGAMLRADVLRLEIERDEARMSAQAAGQRLRDMTALHGRVDDLPGVVG